MASENLFTRLFAPADRRVTVKSGVAVKTIIPRSARGLPFRGVQRLTMPMIEKRFVDACKAAKPDVVAFLWGDISLSAASALRDAGVFVAREKFNCAKAVSRRIVQDAYSKLGAPSAFRHQAYSPEIIDIEHRSLACADLIYCPSSLVAESLIEIGIDPAKLAHSSYGFDPSRLAGDSKALPQIKGTTFIFVGFICVRKGAHILLDAWSQADVKGRLVLVGELEPLIAERYADVLGLNNVEHHRFSKDVGSFYRSADYFVFPSLEEGSPLVTYEAAACGLPSIVSSMGAGPVVRDGVEGVLEPSDSVEAWIARLRAADVNTEAYQAQSDAAALRALQFTWEKVGHRRREQLFERLT